MTPLIIIVIFLSIVFIVVGAWLSLPASMPFAPSRRFIDSLPTWLQGPRRIAPTVKDDPFTPVHYGDPVQHDEPMRPSFFKELQHSDTPSIAPTSDESHEEAVPVEVVHDEP